jgi:hypothetical protein
LTLRDEYGSSPKHAAQGPTPRRNFRAEAELFFALLGLRAERLRRHPFLECDLLHICLVLISSSPSHSEAQERRIKMSRLQWISRALLYDRRYAQQRLSCRLIQMWPGSLLKRECHVA